jgi:hypothetical protein
VKTVRQYGPAWIAAEFLAWVFFPVGLVWMLYDRACRWAGRTPEQRVAQMVRWYPADWRARHGEEFGALLLDAARDGQDGPRLWLDVAREAAAIRAQSAFRPKRTWLAAALWTAGVLLILPGTIVPLLLALGDAPDGFPILEVAAGERWAVAIAVIAAGLLMIAASVRLFRTAHAPRSA